MKSNELALSFRPATEADEVIVASLFDGVQAVEDLPTELQAGLFDVVAEVSVNGTVVASSNPVGFGDLLSTDKGFIDPRFGYRKTTSPITAGDYQAIGLDLQGITVKQAQDLKSQLESVQTKLAVQQFNSLTKHDVVGGLLQGGLLGYFGMNDAINKLGARMNKLVHYRMPSFGTFSTHSQVDTVFGSSATVKLGAVAMDIDWRMSNNEGKKNCWQDWVAFNQMSGQIASAYGHIIPEQIFSTEQQKVEAVSTVKALAVANAEGQKIYTITKSNISQTLPLVTAHNRVKQDIQLAVEAGDMAIIHERPIDYEGYQGSGYILLDPDTGTGAYKITGGGNGSISGKMFLYGFLLAIGIFGVILASSWIVPGAILLNVLSIFLSSTIAFLVGILAGAAIDDYEAANDTARLCFLTGFLVALLPLSIIMAGLAGPFWLLFPLVLSMIQGLPLLHQIFAMPTPPTMLDQCLGLFD